MCRPNKIMVVERGSLLQSVLLSPSARIMFQDSDETGSHPNPCFVLGSHGAKWNKTPGLIFRVEGGSRNLALNKMPQSCLNVGAQ